ncbi:MAG TPA: ABC transporter transmembrane domain-containing protein [Nitrospinaceae bacterium]|jgi:subfamily B ATP-binding cassette protein MsbA|nr:ABC transporter transmembrane domain-containing protein [Nitrospinaceae bacterium]MDP7148687.1 ABC transporter transmembrane domain-containing protein [Nitrospinaceae bacterium]HJO58850.1 ABC transporter transmembrane domain-containing protein [Nitrospinaceae bacterium]|tara:strand:- start:420 stop:2186 length:1767 start_codon:yes stop_codon:yes gene_type:complete
MKNYKRLLQLLLPYKKALLVGSLFLIAASATNLAVPLFIRNLVDIVMVEKNLDSLNDIAITISFLFLIQLVCQTTHNYLFDVTEKRVIADFRKNLFDHLHTMSVSYFVKRRTGEVMSRMTNDVTTIENIVTDLPATALQQSIRLVGGIIIIIYMNWKLTFMILVLAPVLVLFAKTFGRRLKKLSTEIQDKLAVSTTILEENISCYQIVKSFVRDRLESERFSNAIEDSFQSARKRVIISSFFGPSIGFIAFSTSLVLLWYGGREVITGGISPGELIAFILYATIIAGPMGSFARMYTRLQEGLGASERLFELLDTYGDVRDQPDAKPMPPISGRVEFDSTRFHYRKDREVIKNISFTVEPGQMIALVGPSGAGKSTMINLLHRFYDPTEGEIRVDGIPLKSVKLASYWNQVGIVPQETILFGDSIEMNIKYAKEGATDDEVIAAAKAANAHTFIMECPEQYQTIVGEKGIRLSAGQRQRIAIARAILKNPRILMLDEATSALDNESEVLIQEALERLMKNRTSFVIAHRLSTTHNAKWILVMDEGKIVETGNHAELMEKQGLYHRLYTLKNLKTPEKVPEASKNHILG